MKLVLDAPIHTSSAWRGEDLAASGRWIRELDRGALTSFDELAERVAGRAFDDLAAAPVDLDATLDALVRDMRLELEHGTGIVVLRGFPATDRYPLDVVRKLFVTLCARMGRLVPVNRNGEVMSSVRRRAVPGVRVYGGTAELGYHSDPTDSVGLLCLAPPMSGGHSRVVSTHAVHNAILRECPDLLEPLYRNHANSWMGEEPPGDLAWYPAPIFSYYRGILSSRATFGLIAAGREVSPELAPPDDRERAAIELFKEVAGRPGMALDHDLAPGDVQLLNNWVTVHDRDSYQDHPTDPALQRHLLRLWISSAPADARAVCPEFARWRTGICALDPALDTEQARWLN